MPWHMRLSRYIVSTATAAVMFKALPKSAGLEAESRKQRCSQFIVPEESAMAQAVTRSLPFPHRVHKSNPMRMEPPRS